jgi:xylulokinase
VQQGGLATDLLDVFEISPDLFPEAVPTFSEQGVLTPEAADALGLRAGTPVAYRAGDQPNNALSLAALEPGELAATAGTSGVVYGVGDTATYDPKQRVNTFLHVNHSPDRPRYGTLLCVNGTGILNRWLHDALAGPNGTLSYAAMNETAAQAPVGAEGLVVLPYGNGAERTLGNANPGASLHGLNFNVHDRAHLLRAAQEGIVFALHHGLDAMRDMGLRIDTVRAGHANMFLSPIFTEAFATVTGATVELVETDGAAGAARGAGLGTGVFAGPDEAFVGLTVIDTVDPDPNLTSDYAAAYARWSDVLTLYLNQPS